MKWTLSLFTLLMCIALTGVAVASDGEYQQQGVYFNLGLGWADASYFDEMEEVIELLEDLPGVDRMQVGIDLGLYFALQPGMGLGPALTGIGDRLEDDSDHMQFNQYLFGASYRFYPSKMFGKGFFLRADAGMARMVLDMSDQDAQTSDWGFGILLGGGYSWQIGGSTYFSLNADFTSKSIEDENIGGVTIGGAFMF